MARHRKYGEDLTYSEEHRYALPDLYGRIGHRLDLADRDFTEFCHYCKDPLMICEVVRNVGQDLRDKATTVTRRLAERSQLEARLVAWRVERTAEDQQEIDRLNLRLRELEQRSPIIDITARGLWPKFDSRLTVLSPAQWWESVLIVHREHHRRCRRAVEYPVRLQRLLAAMEKHPLHGVTLLDGV